MSDFWAKNENLSDYEELQETIEEQAEAMLDQIEEEESEDYMEEYDEEYEEAYGPHDDTEADTAYSLNSRESSVVSQAKVRLEQARLYEMLIEHDTFKGVKAHPQALKNVKNELKQYIIDRLDILLNIKQEEIEQPKEFVVDSPFNDVEVEFLKALSFKGTKGASAKVRPQQLVVSEIQSVIEDPSDRGGLNAIVQQEPEYEEEYEEEEPKPAPKPVRRKAPPKPAPRPKQKPSPKAIPASKRKPKRKPAKPKKVAKPVSTKGIKRQRRGKLGNDEAEAIAREDMKRMEGRPNKPVHEMTGKELIAANKRISKGNVKIRPANAKPMLNDAQAGMYYQAREMNNNMDPNSNMKNILVQKILSEKNQ
jgi:outer membrane biosynthesis protein TonB